MQGFILVAGKGVWVYVTVFTTVAVKAWGETVQGLRKHPLKDNDVCVCRTIMCFPLAKWIVLNGCVGPVYVSRVFTVTSLNWSHFNHSAAPGRSDSKVQVDGTNRRDVLWVGVWLAATGNYHAVFQLLFVFSLDSRTFNSVAFPLSVCNPLTCSAQYILDHEEGNRANSWQVWFYEVLTAWVCVCG